MIAEHGNSIIYKGDGETTAFSFPFDISEVTDIHVLLIDETGQSHEITSGFFVNAASKTVHYPGYANGAEPSEILPPLTSEQSICIYALTPVTQDIDLPNKWPYDRIEAALDKLTIIEQQNRAVFDRAIVMDYTAETAGVSLKIPSPKPNKVIVWDKTGTKLTLDAYPSDLRDDCLNAAGIAQRSAEQTAEDARQTAGVAEEIGSHIEHIEEIERSLDAASKYLGARATVYDPGKTYIPADIVMLPDGSCYRCLVQSTGEYPQTSFKWVTVTTTTVDTFERDDNNDLMPVLHPQASKLWGIDEDGDIFPREVM